MKTSKRKGKGDTDKCARKCKVCQKTIVGSSYKYNAHLYQHNVIPARFQCSYCEKGFFRKDVFRRHVEQHDPEKKQKIEFTCDYCGRSFIDKRNLIMHLRIHDDSIDFHFKCNACGVRYCENRLLKYHIRKTHYNLHNEESTHNKKQVNDTWIEPLMESGVYVEMTKINSNVLAIKKSFTAKKDCKDEMNDTDEKAKFKKYMNSDFAQTDKSQYSKAKCDYCDKEMLKKSVLTHIREQHLKMKNFHCSTCGRAFSRHYQFVDHNCGKTRKRRTGKVKALEIVTATSTPFQEATSSNILKNKASLSKCT